MEWSTQIEKPLRNQERPTTSKHGVPMTIPTHYKDMPQTQDSICLLNRTLHHAGNRASRPGPCRHCKELLPPPLLNGNGIHPPVDRKIRNGTIYIYIFVVTQLRYISVVLFKYMYTSIFTHPRVDTCPRWEMWTIIFLSLCSTAPIGH